MELEICVDSLDSAVAAESGGAHRVELCSALREGGLTPSLGLIRGVRSRLGIGIHVMIRPRAGDFFYTGDELAVMREDIALAAQAGADGVVFGLLTEDGEVDLERTRALVGLARPMEVTFHRAIDKARNVQSAMEDVVRAGADRVLTSGGEATAVLGRERLRDLVLAADGRIRIMAGGGVRAENVQEIMQATGVVEFHAALRSIVPSPVKNQVHTVHLGDAGVDDYVRNVVRSGDVRILREAMEAALSKNH
jgi:copper homeostasis protein